MKRFFVIILAIVITIPLLTTGCSKNAGANAGKGTYTSLNGFDIDKGIENQLLKGVLADNTYVGYGYDIIDNNYISMENISNVVPILKKDEVKKRLTQDTTAASQKTNTIIGESMSAYYNDFSAQLNVSADYPVFSGKLSLDFKKDSTSTKHTYFIKSLTRFTQYSEYILRNEDFKLILDDGFKADLEGDMEPQKLFETYGTHLIIEALMGARNEFNYTYSTTTTENTTSLNEKVSAAYSYISGSEEIDVKDKATQLLNNSNFVSNLYGGKSIDTITFENLIKNYPSWVESLNTNMPTICGIKNMNSLVAIWDLTTNKERAAELKAYFDSRGKDVKKAIDDMSVVVPDPPIPSDTDYIKEIMILSDKKKTNAVAQSYAGYTIINSDINKDLNKGAGGNFIYIAYETTKDPKQAITSIGITYNDFDLGSKFKKNTHDLNTGANGSFIYIWTSKDKSFGKPIKAIDIFYGKGCDIPEGFSVIKYNDTKDRAELNHHAKGDFIYIAIKK